ncbi:MAG TPA: bifunctional glutamate N-acetyltransferase/amino-acid acetyltransferase ArgJ [Dehalococcoidia bacterium]|nr:bifunctional glutamate N-acetyltransferase/amino-acid acetyltransferase ArgJ [Dehalococcoidia bacterium]
MTSNLDFISTGTITTPLGFLAGATYAGIKSPSDSALDLGILYSEAHCAAAGVFTTNRIKAAPVTLCQRNLKDSRAQAIVVNSGCANACTGEQGLAYAAETASLTAEKLGLTPEAVLVASTGVIGRALPMELVRNSIDRITLSREGGHDLAKSITTTDRFPKETAVQTNLGHEKTAIAIGGIAKGSGMIHPNLATLLCFLATDAAVEPEFLKEALRKAVDVSFNMVTIDGDTSPNDSVIILANGLSGSEMIESNKPGSEEFEKALEAVCLSLAKLIAGDGEGATRLIEVNVEGALTVTDARMGARAIAGSSLVKSAVHGSDPNWGRIIAALGRSGVEMTESKTDLYLDNLCLMKGGCPQSFDRAQARAILNGAEVPVRICLNIGDAAATAWGCDLSQEYVTINSEYTT